MVGFLGLPVWPVVLLHLIWWASTWPERRAHTGRGIGWANSITFVRAVLVGLLASWAALPPEALGPTLGVAGLAFFLDAVDGAVARKTGRATAFGARLDMELDALMVLVLGALVWRLGIAGPWVLIAGAWRYAYVGAGQLAPWLRAPVDPFAPRRYACGVGVGCLILAIALPAPVAWGGAAMAVGVISLSFGRDIIWLWMHRR